MPETAMAGPSPEQPSGDDSGGITTQQEVEAVKVKFLQRIVWRDALDAKKTGRSSGEIHAPNDTAVRTLFDRLWRTGDGLTHE